MQETWLREILLKFKKGELDLERVLCALREFSYEELGFAKVDHHRALRQGFPEVIYCPGKEEAEIARIAKALVDKGAVNVLATRLAPERWPKVRADLEGIKAEYYARARCLVVNPREVQGRGRVLVLSAGTADLPVAEEAVLTARLCGSKVEAIYDVGVAGLHRLLDQQEALSRARVIVVVAGMEGALASVVAGLTDRPVLAVPTSVGYGASFQGLAPLLAMLNACATGVAVLNIDNGFGAGYLASMINLLPAVEEE